MLAKITRGSQITIPKEIIKQAHLGELSSYVEVEYSGGVICLKPVVVEERISPERFEKFEEWALGKKETDVQASSLDEAVSHLKKRTKKS